MTDTKNSNGTLVPMTVTDGITVKVLPNEKHDYLMTTRDVSIGYGTSDYSIRKAFLRNNSELIEGKHFVKGLDILSNPNKPSIQIQPHQIFWTKRGVVKLGFFIKSDRAKLFRNWCEDLVIAGFNNATAAIVVPEINPVDKLMELALEANELKVRKELYHNYLELRDYTESLKKEVAEYKVSHDKWSNFIHKKTKSYQSQKGGQA